MTLKCEIVSDAEFDRGLTLQLCQLLEFTYRNEASIPRGDWSLTFRFTDDSTISETHYEYFDDCSPTDVISFPSGEDLLGTQGYLGDVMISVDTATCNAALDGHSVCRELAFLVLHGLLHLCGHTDGNDEDKERMLGRQQQLLEAFEADRGVVL